MILAWIQFVIAALFIIAGLTIFVLSILGVYRFNYVLNRMHLAATADTLGLLLLMIGCMILSGFHPGTLKLLLLVVFFWLTSPVCSHLLCELEVKTNDELEKECEVTEP